MQTLSFWARPTLFALLWILAAALTLSELATIAPALDISTHAASGAVSARVATVP